MEAKAQYRNIKREELNRVWKIENYHKKKKLENLMPVVPENYQGVTFGSNQLEETFGNPEIKGLILGGFE